MPVLAPSPTGRPPAGTLPDEEDHDFDLERFFDTYGVVPMPLNGVGVPLDLVRAYHNWSNMLSA
ncbi:MAG TPA: hypothetical protein VHV47_00115, partial [Opitutaceae bacterium]|nr:hypothetical protein [Opitutaceae bacterium]